MAGELVDAKHGWENLGQRERTPRGGRNIVLVHRVQHQLSTIDTLIERAKLFQTSVNVFALCVLVGPCRWCMSFPLRLPNCTHAGASAAIHSSFRAPATSHCDLVIVARLYAACIASLCARFTDCISIEYTGQQERREAGR